MIKLYIDAEGDLVGGDSGSDIFNPENLDMMEKLLESQNLSKKDEDEFKDQLEKIKNLEDLTN